MNIPVLFEDDNLIVFNKPAGLIVNNSKSSGDNTLQSYVISNFNQPFVPAPIGNEDEEADFDEFKQRSGIVHRLDKQTSGVILVAKNEEAFMHLQKQFKDRSVSKKYTALIYGNMTVEKAEIEAPIMRNPDYRFKMIMAKEGKEAVTFVEKIKEVTIDELPFTLIHAFPKTGRTHQIRVHLTGIGFPVAGDDIYMTKKQFERVYPLFNRLMLHATEISFKHPKTNETMTVTAELPKEFNL